MADGYFTMPSDSEQVEVVPGIFRRTMATTDEVMICEFFLVRDAIGQPHSHDNDQVGYVVFGKVEITIGNETRICQKGDSYAIPGGIVHNTRALVDSVTIDSFSPPRQDYLTEAR